VKGRKPGKKPQGAPEGPARDALFEQLLQRIIAGAYPPGSRLPSERELAAETGASRNTLREAIRRLEEGRLVSTRHGQGVTVLDFRRTGTLGLLGPFLQYGPSDAERARVLLDVLEPRLIILEQLLTLAAFRRTGADLTALAAVAREASLPDVARDHAKLAQVQDRWLNALVEAAHSLPLCWAANPLLSAINDLLIRQPELMPLDPPMADYTREVVAALGARDAKRAVHVAREWHQAGDAQLIPLLEAAAAGA